VETQPNLLVDLGNRVRELRLAAGLTQEALADLCGLDRTYISGIERGKRNVAIKNLATIAIALKTSLAELLSGIDNAH
jgi:transcriptional regulator with XRE-family HTH domain